MKCDTRIRDIVIDGLVGICFLAVAGGFGYYHLRTQVGTIGGQTGDYSPRLLEPSVMFACGKGLVEVPLADLPQLREFLDQKKPEFDPRSLPEKLPPAGRVGSGEGLRYLLYAAGIVWRLCGISWEALKVLPAVAFGISVALVYGLFRLGANRFLSILGALLFLSSPSVIKMLPCVRDFCKTPFILAAILLMGCLLKGSMRVRTYSALLTLLAIVIGFVAGFQQVVALCIMAPILLISCLLRGSMHVRSYWVLSALLGFVIGIGVGFRQDLVLFILPGLLAVAVGAYGPTRICLFDRVGALVLLLAGFLVLAWPILANMREGYIEQSPHLMQGFSTDCFEELGIGNASYELLYTKHDNYIYATQQSYDRRVNGPIHREYATDPNAATAGRQWVVQAVKSFPADTATRFCAAILWSLGRSTNEEPCQRSGWQQALVAPVTEHLACYGPFYAALTLLLLSARSARLAWSVFPLAVFVCGYVSLLFEFRHSFHLYFVPFWVVAFLIDKAFNGARQVIERPSWQRIKEQILSLRLGWGPPARRMLLFACGASALILVPFWGARLYQYFSVAAILKQYRSAVIEPVATRETTEGDWVLIEPERRLPSLDRSTESAGLDVATEYCVAEFASTAGTFPMRLRYQPEPVPADISGTVEVHAAGSGENETTKYFFPVYEFTVPGSAPDQLPPLTAGGRGRFVGVAVPKARAGQFKGLYRVKNIDDFSLLPSLSLPEDERFVQRCRRLFRGASFQSSLGSRYMRQGRFDKALTTFRRVHDDEPFDEKITASLAISLSMEGGRLAQQGEHKEALAAYREALALDPDATDTRKGLVDALLAMSKTFEQREEWEQALAGYREVESMEKNNVAAHYAMAAFFEKRGDVTGAAATYREIIAVNPDDLTAYSEFDEMYVKQGDNAARVAALRSILLEHPQARQVYLYLGNALELQQEYEGAVEAYQKARQLAPEDAMILGPLVQALMARGSQLLEKGQFNEAIEAFRKILAIDQGNVSATFGETQALEGLGNPSEAIGICRKVIAADPASREPYGRLDELLLRQNKPDERIAVWRELTQTFPNAALAYVYLGGALDAVQDYAAEVEAYRAAHTLDPGDAAAQASLGVSLMRTYHYKEAGVELQSALSRQPGLPAFYYEILLTVLLADKDYDTAWQCVDKCKALDVPLPTQLLNILARDSKRPS